MVEKDGGKPRVFARVSCTLTAVTLHNVYNLFFYYPSYADFVEHGKFLMQQTKCQKKSRETIQISSAHHAVHHCKIYLFIYYTGTLRT